MDDLLERLMDLKVPPAPVTLEREVHDRVNRTLLIQHIIELAIYGATYAGGVLLRGFVGLVAYTITGKFPVDHGGRSDSRNER